MANTFEEQAKDRFRKSQAFMQKASTLLKDDLVYRSAMADAVSSIKNMLQGYLLLRVARSPENPSNFRWQEVAASNRMPDLLQACGEAGLDLRGLAVEIKRLNNERNYRTHDDPLRLVEPDQASSALELAQTVQKRIRSAVQGAAADVASAVGAATPAAALASTSAAVRSPQPPLPVSVRNEVAAQSSASGATPARQAPATPAVSATPSAGAAAARTGTPPSGADASGTKATTPTVDSQEDDDPLSPDDTALTLPTIARRRGRIRRAFLQGLVAAVLVIVGVVAGAGLMLPVASGNAPGWLAFATHLLPASATRTPALSATPGVTPVVSNTPVTLGALTITPGTCAGGATPLTLSNTGATPLHWTVGSADVLIAAFALSKPDASAPDQTPGPTQFGTLAPGATVALSASAPASVLHYHILVVGPQGTLQVLVAAC